MVLGLLALLTAISGSATSYKNEISSTFKEYVDNLRSEIEKEQAILKRAIVSITIR